MIFEISVAPIAFAFIGPSAGQTPGSGGGLFQVDANRNIGFGASSSTPVSTFNSTSTESGPSTFGYVFTVASTTNPGLSLKNLTSGNTYVWSSRNFGNLQLYRESATLPGYVVLDVNQYGDVAIGQKATSTGGVARLFVGGNVQTTGAFVGTLSGGLSAANVSSGVFGSLQGNGNFAFPASLAVGTTTTGGLPTEGLYVKGNVGIGTTSPSGKLDVVSTISTNALILRSGMDNTGSQGGRQIVFGYNGTTDYAHMITTEHDSGVAGGNKIIFSLWKQGDAASTIGGKTVMTLTGAGNVGIGTTTPASALQVNGLVSVGTAPASSLDSSANQLVVGSGAGSQGLTIYSAGDGSILFADGTTGDQAYRGRIIYSHSADKFTINTAGTANSLVMDSSGNVGIATTTPAYTLDVVGTGRFTGQLTVPTPTTGTSAATKSYVDSVASGSSGVWLLSGSNLYASSTSWNVGIGTTNPQQKLHVKGATRFGNRIDIYDGADTTLAGQIAANDDIGLQGGGGPNDLVIKSQDLFSIATGNTTDVRFHINATGNIGIASSSPGYVLTTVGAGYFSQPVIVGTPTANSHAATKSYVDSTVTSGSGWTDSGANVSLTTSGDSVGIGTASPGYKLEIQGGATPTGGVYIKNGGGNPDLQLTGNQGNVYAKFAEAGGSDPGYFQLFENGGVEITFDTNGASYLNTGNNFGIASTTPGYALTVAGTGYFSQPVIVGTPTQASHAATKDYVDSAVTGGGGAGSFTTLTVSGTSTLNGNLSFGGALVTNLNANSKNITGVNKLTVTTIDPLYEIGGKKYATYASAIAGGVKEEYVGRATLVRKSEIRNPKSETNPKSQNSKGFEFTEPTYEYVIDFDKIKSGSDLWVWRKTVDFSRDTVQVLATPYGVPVSIAYEISGNKIIFRSQPTTNHQPPTTDSIEFSYRLVGNRFDWREWPTLAPDQTERPSLIIK
ncbi:MAG: hypothetical protein HYU81_03215 [Candidatus Brennerbacteria bacterium]|nr:hypothetical protein [Candidatus Brennerbacteria bacterium]